MLRKYLKESTTFYTKEDNPMFYIFIIPKLVKDDVEKVKQDNDLKNLINFVEETIGNLNIKPLTKLYSPIIFMDLFSKETVKKNTIDYILQYLSQFETTLASEEKDFIKAYNIHKIFDTIKNSDVFKVYTKNL